ncbi:MAG: hypothetical protein EOP50_07230 [Sphingobacteriales bacterium]|nr:MAG: hypothetical protein EOP50_07230 [Sphingobacteriales bacterium]
MFSRLFAIAFLAFSLPATGQHTCACASIPAEAFRPDCSVRRLSNGGALYYQYTCDSIWLTLENRTGRRMVLYSMPSSLHEAHERVGYQLAREFKTVLLFRNDWVSPTGWNYVVVDKSNGTIKKNGLNVVECAGAETLGAYLAEFAGSRTLVLYNPDTGKRIRLPLRRSDLPAEDPQKAIVGLRLKNRILTVTIERAYGNVSSIQEKTLRFDLRKYGG